MIVPRAIDALARLAGSRLGPLWLAVIGTLLSAPSVVGGLAMDDYLQRALLTDPDSVRHLVDPEAGLYGLVGYAQPRWTLQGMATGAVPWWASPDLQLSFWRPLSAITHRIDYALYPDAPAAMHVQSLVWCFLLTCAAALLYRRMHAAPMIAGLCGLLYAIDDSRAVGAGWIAQRHGLIAALLVVLTVYFHDRGRRRDDQLGALFAWLLPIPGLLSGESYVAVLGYLFAHALTLDRAPLRERVFALVPYLAVILGWHALYAQMGYGTMGSSLYLDPGREPLLFGASLFSRLGLLLGSALSIGMPELTTMMPDTAGKWLTLLHLTALIGFGWMTWPVLRRHPTARFWALGALFSAVPLCAAWPAERLQVIPGIGLMGLVAILLDAALLSRAREVRRGTRALALALVGLHLVLAPLSLAFKSALLGPMMERVDSCGTSLARMPDLASRHAVVFNAPDRCAMLAPIIARQVGGAGPLTLRTLTPGAAETTVTRVDDHTLRLRTDAGMFALPASRLLMQHDHDFQAGQVVPTPELTLTVVEVNGRGDPKVVDARFAQPLDRGNYAFLIAGEHGLRQVPPPEAEQRLDPVAMPVP